MGDLAEVLAALVEPAGRVVAVELRTAAGHLEAVGPAAGGHDPDVASTCIRDANGASTGRAARWWRRNGATRFTGEVMM